MPQIGVDVPNKVMVALSERRISLLLDDQAGQLVQPGQAATALIMSTVVSVSGELKLASVAVRNDTRERSGCLSAPGKRGAGTRRVKKGAKWSRLMKPTV